MKITKIMLRLILSAFYIFNALGLYAFQTSPVCEADSPFSIRTRNDFDQTLLSAEEVDNKIRQIILSQNSIPLLDLATPINEKKFKYLGYMYPVDLGIFEYRDAVSGNPTLANKTHIYQYEELYICTSDKTNFDSFLIYGAIRSYIVLKWRYSYIYENLFLATSSIEKNYIDSMDYISITQKYLISFDEHTRERPWNIQYIGPPVKISFNNITTNLYSNTQALFFNKNAIRCGGQTGKLSIYEGYERVLTERQKVIRDMNDGFISTFVHERLHDFILNNEERNALCYFLRTGCVEKKIVKNSYTLEEIAVTNTTNILFNMLPENGGLSKNVLGYYDLVFAEQIESLDKKLYNKAIRELMNYYNDSSLQAYNISPIFNYDINSRLFFLDISKPCAPALQTDNNIIPNIRKFNYKKYVADIYKKIESENNNIDK